MIWFEFTGNGLAWFLAWLFARAAFHKLAAPMYYRRLIGDYAGGPGSSFAVWLIVVLEACIALALLVSQWRPAGLALAAALLLVYAGLMAAQILNGRAGMACGCAGSGSQLGISWALVVRNGVCAALALLATCAAGAGTTGWIGYGAPGLVALFSIIVYLASDAIIGNAQWMDAEDQD